MFPSLWSVIRLYVNAQYTSKLDSVESGGQQTAAQSLSYLFFTDGGQVIAARLLTKYFHRLRKMEKLYTTAEKIELRC
ncbi:hypothetical protein GE061_000997 [Apolygus lucorum]|uniref:Uncharacterized protein n=1 Tax=Apolygus lucorum TaxID=248454 RepID=A0A8S9Y7S8_APOLU|nr:hypothetical protein GE061_000997 [Apolygus lucorum]